MAQVPNWKLRRLATRAKRVQARRAAESPAITAFGATLQPKADAYITAYDAAMKYTAHWRKEMSEGGTAVATLTKELRGWLALVLRDVPGFDGSSYNDSPRVADDVVEDAERLMDVLEEYRDPAGLALAYSPQALARLGALPFEAVEFCSECPPV
ncbi:MAG: hypothetical protein JW940_18575 [Polyangiaceae bacterium]|nr:hypothetical protein [Polyangiaceae bacterium]